MVKACHPCKVRP